MNDKGLMDLKHARPEVELIGRDGAVMSVVVSCKRAARKFGCSKAAVEALRNEMLEGDYQHVLNKVDKYFTVQ